MKSSIIPAFQAREAARRSIQRQIAGRYEEEMKRAGWWRRLAIEIQIQREIEEELKRRFPPHALYATRLGGRSKRPNQSSQGSVTPAARMADL